MDGVAVTSVTECFLLPAVALGPCAAVTSSANPASPPQVPTALMPVPHMGTLEAEAAKALGAAQLGPK